MNNTQKRIIMLVDMQSFYELAENTRDFSHEMNRLRTKRKFEYSCRRQKTIICIIAVTAGTAGIAWWYIMY